MVSTRRSPIGVFVLLAFAAMSGYAACTVCSRPGFSATVYRYAFRGRRASTLFRFSANVSSICRCIRSVSAKDTERADVDGVVDGAGGTGLLRGGAEVGFEDIGSSLYFWRRAFTFDTFAVDARFMTP